MRHLFILLTVILFSSQVLAQEASSSSEPFGTWLQKLRQDARLQGISQATLDTALSDIQPDDQVIELDRKQPETVLTLEQYLAHIVTQKRIDQGQDGLEDNRAVLAKVSKKYGVQPRFIVALWGIESNYGSNIGNFGVIEALATLAYDGRRPDFFRGELIKALKIIDEEHISPTDMDGSWAGAMGQCQFMPSSFLQYAVDFDGDGKRDIWRDKADVFASIANYLQSSGWNGGEGTSRPVKLPAHFNRNLIDIGKTKSLSEWKRLGVKAPGGKALPESDVQASLIMVGEDEDAVPYLVTGNFKVLLKWNRSRYFATAVGMLADKIGD